MKRKIVKIGNALGVTLPQEIREDAGLKLGDSVSVGIQNNAVLLSPIRKKKKIGGVDAKFMKLVDDFINEHEDVLEELAKR